MRTNSQTKPYCNVSHHQIKIKIVLLSLLDVFYTFRYQVIITSNNIYPTTFFDDIKVYAIRKPFHCHNKLLVRVETILIIFSEGLQLLVGENHS